jgi:hypothetical protein
MLKKKESLDFIIRLLVPTGVQKRSRNNSIMKSLTLKEGELIKLCHFSLDNYQMTSKNKNKYLYRKVKLNLYEEMSRLKDW